MPGTLNGSNFTTLDRQKNECMQANRYYYKSIIINLNEHRHPTRFSNKPAIPTIIISDLFLAPPTPSSQKLPLESVRKTNDYSTFFNNVFNTII